MRELNWLDKGQTVSSTTLSNLEIAIGHRLPDDVLEAAAQHSGATNPNECEFETLDRKGRRYLGTFGGLLAFEGRGSESVLKTLDNLGEQLPSGVIPIVKTGSGDYVCLDYRSASDASIVYFAHEKIGEDSLFAVAPSFTTFLDMLVTPKD